MRKYANLGRALPLLAALVLLAAAPALAAGRGVPCPATRFLFAPNAFGLTAIEVGPGAISLPHVCAGTPPTRFRTGLRGVTHFAARWSECSGLAGPVRVRGQLVDGCSRLKLRVRSRGVRTRLEGARPALDRFGGLTHVMTTATGRFRVEQIDGVWWFVTPEGHPFFSAGVNHLDPSGDFSAALGTSPYEDAALARWGSYEGWAVGTMERLRAWGFNTAGAFSRNDLFAGRFPYTPVLSFHAAAPEVPGWPRGASGGVIRDVFAPAFASGAVTRAESARACSRDPFCVGVFSDNELMWGPSSIRSATTSTPT